MLEKSETNDKTSGKSIITFLSFLSTAAIGLQIYLQVISFLKTNVPKNHLKMQKIALICFSVICLCFAEDIPLDRALLDPEIAQIPEDILNCYTDGDLWNRYTRLPSR